MCEALKPMEHTPIKDSDDRDTSRGGTNQSGALQPGRNSRRVVDKIDELGAPGRAVRDVPRDDHPVLPVLLICPAPVRDGRRAPEADGSGGDHPLADADAIGEAAREAGMVVSIGVNERDGGTPVQHQLLFDADGTLIQRRRKITPTYHERMIWGAGRRVGLRRSTAPSDASASWPAGSITTRWPVMRWSPTASRSTRPCGPDPSAARCSPSRPRSASAITPSSRVLRRECHRMAGR